MCSSCTCVDMFVRTCECKCVHVSVLQSIFYVCACVSACVCVCECVCVSACVYVYVYACVCASACVNVYVYVRMSLYGCYTYLVTWFSAFITRTDLKSIIHSKVRIQEANQQQIHVEINICMHSNAAKHTQIVRHVDRIFMLLPFSTYTHTHTHTHKRFHFHTHAKTHPLHTHITEKRIHPLIVYYPPTYPPRISSLTK